MHEALMVLNQALGKHPGNADIHGVRGGLYLEMGEFSRALADTEEGIDNGAVAVVADRVQAVVVIVDGAAVGYRDITGEIVLIDIDGHICALDNADRGCCDVVPDRERIPDQLICNIIAAQAEWAGLDVEHYTGILVGRRNATIRPFQDQWPAGLRCCRQAE